MGDCIKSFSDGPSTFQDRRLFLELPSSTTVVLTTAAEDENGCNKGKNIAFLLIFFVPAAALIASDVDDTTLCICFNYVFVCSGAEPMKLIKYPPIPILFSD